MPTHVMSAHARMAKPKKLRVAPAQVAPTAKVKVSGKLPTKAKRSVILKLQNAKKWVNAAPGKAGKTKTAKKDKCKFAINAPAAPGTYKLTGRSEQDQDQDRATMSCHE